VAIIQKITYSGKFGPFFSWKFLCLGRNNIFQVEIWREFASEGNAEAKFSVSSD
jgi:hypothetical protein